MMINQEKSNPTSHLFNLYVVSDCSPGLCCMQFKLSPFSLEKFVLPFDKKPRPSTLSTDSPQQLPALVGSARETNVNKV